jgi:hypothetical protein
MVAFVHSCIAAGFCCILSAHCGVSEGVIFGYRCLELRTAVVAMVFGGILWMITYRIFRRGRIDINLSMFTPTCLSRSRKSTR